MRRNRSAFTLFEVVVACLVLSMAILVSLALLPTGLKAQQMSRLQLYACAIAQNLMEAFHNPINSVSGMSEIIDQKNNGREKWDKGPPDPTKPPYPGIASRYRNHGNLSAPFQYDFERITCGWAQGAIPVPTEIARRIDSPYNEIQNILDQGGYLFYPDPRFLRGLSIGATRSGDLDSTPQPEAQKLIFAVTGYAQQNALTASPTNTAPWHEIYPFPPQYMTSRMGREIRKGPKDLLPSEPVYKAPPAVNIDPSPQVVGINMLDGNTNHLRWVDDGFLGYDWNFYAGPFTPDPADVNAINDLENSKGSGAEGSQSRYIGRNWLYFKRAMPGSPWDTAWAEFKALAMDPKAGWLPVRAVPAGISGAVYNDLLPTYTIPNPAHPTATLTLEPRDRIEKPKTTTAAFILLSTYEMRASYRDRALRLWMKLKPASATTLTPTLNINDATIDVDQYEFSPSELDKFTSTDPYAAGAFPPHPAQVLALSFLAHASMLITGLDAPWQSQTFNDNGTVAGTTRLNKSTLLWTQWKDEHGGYFKDAKTLGSAALLGALSLQISTRPDETVQFYKGDRIALEADLDAGVDKTYLVTADKLISPGSAGSITITPGLATVAALNSQVIRVANDHDRAFARKVHEMCLRWAMAYASENPYDWGAPRPANRQTMIDRPLVMWDMFHDAGNDWQAKARDGLAQRVRKGTADMGGAAWNQALGAGDESFYRPIMTRNTSSTSWFMNTFSTNATPSLDSFTSPFGAFAPSHYGPVDAGLRNWLSIQYNPQMAPPTASNDAKRYWLNRQFAPFHRGRQLVFWAADWKSYEDAETAPSAPIDFAKHGRVIEKYSSGNVNVIKFLGGTSVQLGNPENNSLFTDSTRSLIYAKLNTGDYAGYSYQGGKADWSSNQIWADVQVGHWGADRNNNGRLDRGSIPRSVRMRAQPIARFNFYDPVVRLHVND